MALILLVFTSYCGAQSAPPAVAHLKARASGIWAYTKNVRSVQAGGVSIRVGMTSDELLDAAQRGRLYTESQNEVRGPDGLRVIRRYTDGKVDFEARIARVYSNGALEVTSLALLEELPIR